MTNPTFLAKKLLGGSTALQCRETAERFIVGPNDPRGDCFAYREGQLMVHGPRAFVLSAVESAAKWSLKNKQLAIS